MLSGDADTWLPLVRPSDSSGARSVEGRLSSPFRERHSRSLLSTTDGSGARLQADRSRRTDWPREPIGKFSIQPDNWFGAR